MSVVVKNSTKFLHIYVFFFRNTRLHIFRSLSTPHHTLIGMVFDIKNPVWHTFNSVQGHAHRTPLFLSFASLNMIVLPVLHLR